MVNKINWLKLKIEELFHVRKKGEEEEARPIHLKVKPTIELAMVVIEIILVIYLILGLIGIVPIF